MTIARKSVDETKILDLYRREPGSARTLDPVLTIGNSDGYPHACNRIYSIFARWASVPRAVF